MGRLGLGEREASWDYFGTKETGRMGDQQGLLWDVGGW